MLARRAVVAFVLAFCGGAALSAVALAALSSSLDDAVAVHDSLVSRVLLALRPTLTEIVSVNDSLATVSMIARSDRPISR